MKSYNCLKHFEILFISNTMINVLVISSIEFVRYSKD